MSHHMPLRHLSSDTVYKTIRGAGGTECFFMHPLIFSAVFIFIAFSVLFGLSPAATRRDVIELSYGPVMIGVALSGFFLYSAHMPLQAAVVCLVIAWGVHLFARRYVRRRGREAPAVANALSVRAVFLRGLVVWLVSFPVVLIESALEIEWNLFAFIGMPVWLAGFVLEAAAGYQLDRFLSHPENREKSMTRGVFRYSRHPDYVGVSLVWWGFALMAFSNPNLWIAVVSPAVATYALVAVAIHVAEKRLEAYKGYREYQARTARFIPRPPGLRIPLTDV